MIISRSLAPKERLLKWYVEDNWEPLCKYLRKPIPDVHFFSLSLSLFSFSPFLFSAYAAAFASLFA